MNSFLTVTDLQLSCNAALLHFRLPEVGKIELEDGSMGVKIHSYESSEPTPLSIHHSPLSFTFGFVDGGEIHFLDPQYNEETVMHGRMTVIVNLHGEICGMHKIGGPSVTMEQIILCTNMAKRIVKNVGETLRNALNTADTAAVRDLMIRARRMTGEWSGSEIKKKQSPLPSATLLPIVEKEDNHKIEMEKVKTIAMSAKKIADRAALKKE